MAVGESPAVARRRLRLALRREREAKRLTQGQVARALDWSLSKVQRIEGGEVAVSSTDLRALLDLLGITDRERVEQMLADAKASRKRGWWDEPKYREHLTPATMQLLQFETEASVIRVFQPTLIPGVLQTPDYAQFIMDFVSSELSEADRAARMEVRMLRREHLLDGPDPPKYLLILDESVLHREVGGPHVMAEQLYEVLKVASRPKITVRIAPFTEAALLAVLGPFTIFDLGDEENAVLYREGQLMDEILHSPDVISRHRSTYEQLWETSLDNEASARLIEARAAAMLSAADRRRYG